VPLYAVRELARWLDRDRLLNDDAYVPPYFALLWSGSRELAAALAARAAELSGKTVLEAGCGLGLPSLVAAAAGARVTALDREAAAIEFVRASGRAGDVEIETVVGELDRLRDRRFDFVVAAELLYERERFDDLAEGLVDRVAPGGALWIADASRVDTRPFFAALDRFAWLDVDEAATVVREEGTPVRVRTRFYRAPAELRGAGAGTRITR